MKIGSLPRTQSILEQYDANPDSPPSSSILEEAVEETVRRQVEVGITFVGDGEMSKPSYVSYVTQRLTGFEGSALGPGTADLADFPEFAKQQVKETYVDSIFIEFITIQSSYGQNVWT